MTQNKHLPGAFNIEEHHADNLADFLDCLDKSRFWYLLPHGESAIEQALGIVDTHTGLRYPVGQELRTFLDRNPFVYLRAIDSEQNLATLHSKTLLLWSNDLSAARYSLSAGMEVVKECGLAALKDWRLPTKIELQNFAMASGNPCRKGLEYRLGVLDSGIVGGLSGWLNSNQFFDGAMSDVVASGEWLTDQGRCNTEKGSWVVDATSPGYIFACNSIWRGFLEVEMLSSMASHGWKLVAPEGHTFQSYPGRDWQGISSEKLLANLVLERLQLRAVDDAKLTLNPRNYWINLQLIDLDYTPCRLPKLDAAQLGDPEKGLWELWGEPVESLSRFELIARDPGRDVQRRAVTIDFGTSSTVVAMDTSNGGRELLRIGVRDFYQSVQPQDFENPTVLECLDYSAFEQAWTEHAYRPSLDWNWMRAAHEAQVSFRDNPGDTRILASILPRLKQWALRSSEHRRVRITDRQGREVELAPHSEHNPVRGQPLCVSPEYPFDPIELYAWFLGMAINWRGRGIFLKYYLSFPVKYPREVKDRILASFRRGLQRSLPYSLIEHHPQVLNDFEVSDLASEPAAYAAAALPHLGVEPSEEGVPYAVFDFGGGTSDFDYGLLRWATEEEENQGYEQVFEHLASSGDNFLGGENLLEHLVYESFRHNLEVLRKERIQFTKPLDAHPFAGSEAFLAATQAAQTNTVMLAAKLRPFLEGGKPELVSQIKLDLIDANGNKKACELALDAQALDDLLATRVRLGVEAFLAELARIQEDLPAGAPIQLLLAGNGSRSRHVQCLFNTQGSEWAELLSRAFAGNPPEIVVHQPLPMSTDNPHAPTTKTGVALGLLRLVPGKNTLLVDHLRQRHDGQAPFAWFVGRLRRGRFDPTLTPSAAYGQWHELGPLQQGVFNLYASCSPRSHHGLPEGDPELKMHRLDFPAAPLGARLFARAIAPNGLELMPAMDIHHLGDSTVTSMALD